ncbi:MAG: response regulator transcription factor, partial [Acidobacteria bacterium]|nr:response regulator transcription factor [Acidobacteriota bacterium]
MTRTVATQKKIRVLIADRRPVFRMGLRLLLQKEADISVVGEVDRGDHVIKKVAALKPQVIVLHARLGEANGRSILQQIHRSHSKSRLLILISSDEEEDQVKALRLSAAQILPKHAPARILIQWIRQSEGSKGEVAEAGARPVDDPTIWEDATTDSSPLSARERQVVELVSQGFKNR